MKLFRFAAILLLFASCTRHSAYNYPVARKVDTVTNYFGAKVADPYRWMENDTSKERDAWIKAENQLTQDYLSKIPYRQTIKSRLEQLYNYSKYSRPFRKGKYYFYTKNDGMQNQSVWYVQEGLNGTPRVLLDPNKLSTDGTTSVSVTGVSHDCKYFAYGISKAGSDWNEFYVIDLDNGKQLSDTLKHIKFSGIAWKGDGFFYNCYDVSSKGSELTQKNEYSKIYYHHVGTPQSSDSLVFEDKEHPLRITGAQVTNDERYLIFYGTEAGDNNTLAVKDLRDKNSKFITLVGDFKNIYSVIGNVFNTLYIYTNWNAPMYRLMSVDLNHPDTGSWTTVIPEKQQLLQDVAFCNDMTKERALIEYQQMIPLTSVEPDADWKLDYKKVVSPVLIASYLKDVSSDIIVYDLNGKQVNEIKLPGLGIASFSSTLEDTVAFYSFSNYTTPASIYIYDPNKNTSSILFKSSSDFKTDDYETKQVFYPSKDGTKIPMYIVYKKGLKMDGNNPCFLYAYGGFNISILPGYSPNIAVFLENGGVYAVPNLRGGGEYGEKWHEAGTKLHKQNVFDDFIAAAQYLIDNNYTSHDKLAIHGRSNGGLLIGATMTERPDLAKVAIPSVGVMDMLRYHKFTIGWSWASDYGTSDDSVQFRNLIKFSPLHNIKDVEYPATLVTTADHDDRVVPAHSLKFIATLQEHQQGDEPVLVRIDHNAGHGGGKPVSMLINEWTDIWSFVFYNLGMQVKG